MSMIPIFSLKLDHGIETGRVTVGKFDGVHPSLTCATTAGKVTQGEDDRCDEC